MLPSSYNALMDDTQQLGSTRSAPKTRAIPKLLGILRERKIPKRDTGSSCEKQGLTRHLKVPPKMILSAEVCGMHHDLHRVRSVIVNPCKGVPTWLARV